MSEDLSRREREIMRYLYKRGSATAEDIRADMGGEVSNSAVRTMLGLLEQKGLLRHVQEGKRFIYQPVQDTGVAGTAALREVMQTFFSGSAVKTVAALFDANESLDEGEFSMLEDLIEKAKREGR